MTRATNTRALLPPPLGAGLCLALAIAAGCPPPPDDTDDTDAGTPGALVRVVKAGDGTGSIASTPEGVDCDTACAEQEVSFPLESTAVTLTATPARDALFERWSCAATRGGEPLDPIVVTTAEVTAFDDANPRGLAVTCTAAFRQLWTLQVVFSGTGSGSVVGAAPAAGGGTRIDCPDKCVAGYFHGEQETLTAIPDPGSVFVEWKLDCDGSAPASVLLDDDKNCEAHFCPEADPTCP